VRVGRGDVLEPVDEAAVAVAAVQDAQRDALAVRVEERARHLGARRAIVPVGTCTSLGKLFTGAIHTATRQGSAAHLDDAEQVRRQDGIRVARRDKVR